MALYTVHTPPEGKDDGDPMRVVFIKEGFSWPALLFPEIWLIVQRLWLVLAGYVAIVVVIAVGGGYLNDDLGFGLIILFRLYFAVEANGLRRWTYETYGWQFAGVVEGRNLAEAEIRFFSEWHEGAGMTPAAAAPPAPPAAPPPPATPALPWSPTVENGGVVGLFPTPGART